MCTFQFSFPSSYFHHKLQSELLVPFSIAHRLLRLSNSKLCSSAKTVLHFIFVNFFHQAGEVLFKIHPVKKQTKSREGLTSTFPGSLIISQETYTSWLVSGWGAREKKCDQILVAPGPQQIASRAPDQRAQPRIQFAAPYKRLERARIKFSRGIRCGSAEKLVATRHSAESIFTNSLTSLWRINFPCTIFITAAASKRTMGAVR